MPNIGAPKVTKIMVTIFRVFGLWPNTSRSLTYQIYSYTLHFIFTFIYLLCLCVKLYLIRKSTMQLINACGMVITLIALNIKVVNCFVQNRRIQQCLQAIEDFELVATAEEHLRDSKVNFFTTVTYFLYGMANTAGLSLYVTSWGSSKLPLPAWYPGFDIEINRRDYLFLYTYQVLGMIMLSNLNVTMELFPSYLMFMISTKMDVLGLRLRDIGRNTQNDGVLMENNNISDQKRTEAELKGAIKTHQLIVYCVSQVQNAFDFGFFAQLSASGAIICITGIQLTVNSPSDDYVAYAFYISFLISLTIQLCMPCYFANEVCINSEALTNCAYDSEWYRLSKEYRLVLIVLLERIKRNSVITAGKLFPLNLDTFRAIMSFAYKLYALVANLK